MKLLFLFNILTKKCDSFRFVVEERQPKKLLGDKHFYFDTQFEVDIATTFLLFALLLPNGDYLMEQMWNGTKLC